jgi:hypothetical protein
MLTMTDMREWPCSSWTTRKPPKRVAVPCYCPNDYEGVSSMRSEQATLTTFDVLNRAIESRSDFRTFHRCVIFQGQGGMRSGSRFQHAIASLYRHPSDSNAPYCPYGTTKHSPLGKLARSSSRSPRGGSSAPSRSDGRGSSRTTSRRPSGKEAFGRAQPGRCRAFPERRRQPDAGTDVAETASPVTPVTHDPRLPPDKCPHVTRKNRSTEGIQKGTSPC